MIQLLQFSEVIHDKVLEMVSLSSFGPLQFLKVTFRIVIAFFDFGGNKYSDHSMSGHGRDYNVMKYIFK